jgi:fatty-acyl-CoA synthase
MTTTFEGPSLADVEGIGALTLGGFLEEVADRFASNEATVFDDPMRHGATLRWTYADLRGEARAVAKALQAAGVQRGERVAVLMGNRPEAIAGIFGAALAGAVAVPLSTFAPKPELVHLLGSSRAVAVLTQSALLARRFGEDVEALRPELPELRTVAVLGEGSWDDLLYKGHDVTDADLDAATMHLQPEDDGLIIFSSGTTSRPKGMVHAHRAPTLQLWLQARLWRRHEATRLWTALPIFWTAGFNTAVGATLAAGGCWVAQETFEPGEALRLMTRERVTEPYTLPHQTGALEEHPDWAAADLSSLRYVFGKSAFARHPSVTDPDRTWNLPVGYGLSETCSYVCAHEAGAPLEARKRSMGRLLPGTRLRIVDPETGAVLGPNRDGELAVAGPTLMRHYIGLAPEECLDADGFFHTGDAGFVDDDGEVHFTGRRTEMIKTGGANVSPAELEVELRACPPVKLSRIVGVPDERLDQLVVACIELKDGAAGSEADIQAFLRERVASYKVPTRVLFFAPGEIPMTGSDTKVRDDELLELVTTRLEQG